MLVDYVYKLEVLWLVLIILVYLDCWLVVVFGVGGDCDLGKWVLMGWIVV